MTAARLRVATLLAVPVLAVYLASCAGPFQFDDYNVIVDNPVVHSLAAWWAELPRGNRPLLKLSYALDWISGGGRPLAYHLVNLGVHLLNTGLVYALARRIVAAWGEPAAAKSATAALLAALLFGLHPAQTEAVTYISGRSASLMATFYLGAALAYVAGTLRRRPLLAYGLSPALFVLAVATKESAVSLPVALLAWEASRGGRWAGRDAMRRLGMHAAVLLVIVFVLLIHPVYAHRLVPDLAAQALHDNLLSEAGALTHLAARLVVPYPLNIDPDLRRVAAWSAGVAGEAFALLAALGFGAWALRKRPWLGFGIVWFFAVLLPTNSVLPRLDLANDRQLYLAGVGMCIALAVELELWRQRAGPGAAAVCIALLAVLAGMTVARNFDYASEVRLWEQTVRHSPGKARPHNNLGFAYSAAGCPAQAQAAYRQALALDPTYALARANLDSLLAQEPLPQAGC